MTIYDGKGSTRVVVCSFGGAEKMQMIVDLIGKNCNMPCVMLTRTTAFVCPLAELEYAAYALKLACSYTWLHFD